MSPRKRLAGRVPQERRRRFCNRSLEAPVLVDVYAWTDGRLIFNLLVWPSLGSPAHRAPTTRRRGCAR